eukprot:3953419-Pyramimonas_sp.AAC.1
MKTGRSTRGNGAQKPQSSGRRSGLYPDSVAPSLRRYAEKAFTPRKAIPPCTTPNDCQDALMPAILRCSCCTYTTELQGAWLFHSLASQRGHSL